MVTTSYISPDMEALDSRAKERGIIILNEIGEDPGIDHMGAKKTIDEVKALGGKVKALYSYGAGLPSFEFNRNPMGYKFSWSPRGVMLAARTPAAYLKAGKRIDVPAEILFEHHWLVDIEGLGTFETYPNRDSTRYRPYFELDEDVTLYRGLFPVHRILQHHARPDPAQSPGRFRNQGLQRLDLCTIHCIPDRPGFYREPEIRTCCIFQERREFGPDQETGLARIFG